MTARETELTAALAKLAAEIEALRATPCPVCAAEDAPSNYSTEAP